MSTGSRSTTETTEEEVETPKGEEEVAEESSDISKSTNISEDFSENRCNTSKDDGPTSKPKSISSDWVISTAIFLRTAQKA